MIQELKTFICDAIPSDEDILQSIDLVKNGDFAIKLLWNVPYSGTYHVIISYNSTLESVKQQMPEIYPI